MYNIVNVLNITNAKFSVIGILSQLKKKTQMDVLELRNHSKQNKIKTTMNRLKNRMEGTNEKSSKTKVKTIKIMQFEQQRENRF